LAGAEGRLARNELRIAGELIQRAALRHTPSGVPVLELRMRHVSEQFEAGKQRRVECEIQALALGPAADLLAAAPLGTGIEASGFLAAKSLRNGQPVLHVTNIEFVEGNDNGIQTEETP
jgi:primosomal replication protein N